MKTFKKAGIKTCYKLHLDNSTIDEGEDQRYVYDFFANDEEDTQSIENSDTSKPSLKWSRKSSNQSKVIPPIRTSLTSASDSGEPFDEAGDSVKQKSAVLSLNEYLNFEADHFKEVKDRGKADCSNITSITDSGLWIGSFYGPYHMAHIIRSIYSCQLILDKGILWIYFITGRRKSKKRESCGS